MARIGETKCWNPRCTCADAAVHKTSGGALSAKCHKCMADMYAKPGTKAFRDLEAVTRMDESDAPAPAPAATPKAAPKAPPPPAPAAPAPARLILG